METTVDEFADLELSLHRREGEGYAVEMRFTQPGSDADVRLGQSGQVTAAIDVEALQAEIMDSAAYGKLLAQSLFADANLLAGFKQAIASSQTLKVPLRVRLLIGASAPELNAVYWEALRDPQDGSPLFTGENMFFSRYLSSTDLRPVRLRAKGDLRALVAVANPSNLSDYKLAEVKAQEEMDRAKSALGEIPITFLPVDANEKCTLNKIAEKLRDGYDIFYFAGHGALIKNEPFLWLEDDQGKVARTSALDLATRIKEIQNPPRLIVLASCQSAGTGSGNALQGIGPRLAEAGVPAVIAMQGNILMDTVSKFMPVLFAELQKDGSIDRAVAVARGMIRAQADYWMPALFMRLKSGRIWYVPGFGQEGGGFEKWPALIRYTEKGQTTPILGPGMSEVITGSWRDAAQEWAEKYHFPLSPYQRDALPQVAQYLAVNQDRNFPRDAVEDRVRTMIQNRFAAALPDDLKQGRASIESLIQIAGSKLRESEGDDSFEALAKLPIPMYITTTFDNLMFDALKAAGKTPERAICPWNEDIDNMDSIFEKERDYRPDANRPLVYHMFGHFSQPNSLVLTEDDYFDFLIGVTSNKDLVSAIVRRTLADSALMFLGFQLDDWSFRVFFRTIMGQQGGGRRSRYAHIGVQIDPDETRTIEPSRARKYMESYFQNADISIYWGHSNDFVKELSQQWSQKAA
jgi:hypothetical protein